MSIKLKLLLTYTALFVISLGLLLLYFLLGLVVLRSPSGDKQKIYQAITGRIQQDINRTDQPEYFRNLAQEMEIGSHKMGIVVWKGKSSVYTSSKFLPKNIRVFGGVNWADFLTDRDRPFFTRFQRIDFRFRDGTPGAVLIYLDIKKSLLQYTKNFLILMVLGLTLLLGLLLYFNTQSIIRPLRQLKEASEQIRSGDLNVSIRYRGKNEISKFAAAFEEMRIRLKESLKSQQQYEASQKGMVAGISQNLKTPVSNIKSYVAAITDGVSQSDETLNRYVRTIAAEAAEIDRAINELFLYSRLELKKVPFQFERINLTDYFRDCLEEWRFVNVNQGCSFRFAELFTPVLVIADRGRLAQIAQLTARNLTKTDPNGAPSVVDLAVHEEREMAVITFRKEIHGLEMGKGVFPWIAPGESGGDPVWDESKLELAIVRLLIEAHGGKLRIEASGHEATVTFSLPRVSQG